MKTLIPARCFTDAENFRREQSVFGQGMWQFVCTWLEVRDHNDFVRRDLGGIPVVIQNFNGALKAFHNVCSHRFAPIQTEPCGNRKLTCGYHGWSYDENGVPLGIPHNEAWYALDRSQKECLALRQFQVAKCGQMVFVRIERGGSSLEEFLGDWFAFYESLSGSFGDVLFKTEITTRSNWKLLVENGYDSTHVQFVHPTTLGQVEFTSSEWKGDNRADADTLLRKNIGDSASDTHPELNYALRHSAAFVNMSENQGAIWDACFGPYFPERSFKVEQYIHANLFPNIIITSLMGYYNILLNFEPKSPDETVVHFYVLPSAQNPGAKELPPGYLHHLGLESLRTYTEDMEMQRNLQSMAGAVERPGIFGRREDKMKAFEAAYLCAMGMNLLN